jgi:hypothetical protein
LDDLIVENTLSIELDFSRDSEVITPCLNLLFRFFGVRYGLPKQGAENEHSENEAEPSQRLRAEHLLLPLFRLPAPGSLALRRITQNIARYYGGKNGDFKTNSRQMRATTSRVGCHVLKPTTLVCYERIQIQFAHLTPRSASPFVRPAFSHAYANN